MRVTRCGSRRRGFTTLDLNDWLKQRCKAFWAELSHGGQPGSIADAWESEATCLMRLGRPFDGFMEYGKRVSPTCLVHFDRNRYSVPASFTNHGVNVRVYPERIVFVAEGHAVCEHERIPVRRRYGNLDQHCLEQRQHLLLLNWR